MTEIIRKFHMPDARRSLRATVNAIEPAAGDYIDWDCFEAELEALFAGKSDGVTKQQVTCVFSQAVTRARMTYRAAVNTGNHWKQ